MKCGLKDGLISVLFIIFILPSKGVEIPLLLQTNLALNKPMNFKQFKAAINKLQDLDSFPDTDDSRNNLHKIVKKQMATSDSKDLKKNKRSVLSVFNLPESFDQSTGDGTHIRSRDERTTKKEANSFEYSKPSQYFRSNQRHDNEFSKEFLGKLKDLAKDKQINKKVSIKKNEKKRSLYDLISGFDSFFTVRDKSKEKKAEIKSHSAEKALKEKEGGSLTVKGKPYALTAIKEKLKYTFSEAKEKQSPVKTDEPQIGPNVFLRSRYTRIPDENDYRYYYECETKPFGLMKLKHKRCPEGQYFSNKYLRCLRAKPKTLKKIKRLAACPSPKKTDIFDTSEDPEPANEWLDVNQGPIQKVPPEFKPKKLPELKIYHLCSKRKKKEMIQEKNKKRHAVRNAHPTYLETKRNLAGATRGAVKGLRKRRHKPRSFLIRINKKEGNENQDDNITENDEDEEDSDEEYDEEDSEDEDEETEEEDVQENTEDEKEEEKFSYKDGLKGFFKSAKAAVTNKARFDDPTRPEPNVRQKEISLKSKKSEDSGDSEDKSKKILLDANIRVDSAIGNVLKCILKSKEKGNKDSHISSLANDEALICDRGSQDQLDPELLRMYEHLIRNNPRVKRYFLANCAKKGN